MTDLSDDTLEPPAPLVVEALVESHRAFLSFLQSRVGDRAVAEDILQEAFVRGLRAVGSLRDEGALVPWFYRVLRNAAIDYQRRKATGQRALDRLAAELETDGPAPAGSDLHLQLCQCITRLASTLKPEYAEALERVDVQDLPVKDYAAQLGISANHAGVRLFRARNALRKRVQQACGTCATHGCLNCTCGGA